jgi:hypothetical protein
LKAEAWNTKKEILRSDANGTLTIHQPLPAWALLLVHQL